ncbi:MAG: hypothetical protein AAFP10_08830 [Pseudomonadota bacterium]
MPLFFNRAGPSRVGKHYLIDPLQRMDMTHIGMLLEEENYFVLHAPRQTGKTTYLIALMDELNTQGIYQTLYVNIERAQAAREHVQRGIDAVVEAITSSAEVYLQDHTLSDWLHTQRHKYTAESLLHALLQY